MRGNHWESLFGITGFGESHGPVIGVLLEDIKPGIEFPFDRIQALLDERRPGRGKYSTSRKEEDKIKVLSGVFEGKTTGMPICLIVENRDHRQSEYDNIEEIFRPGHADYSWYKKFKIFDYRGGGRASGRETISRVAASGLVDSILGKIVIDSYPVQIGEIKSEMISTEFENDLKWKDSGTYSQVLDFLDKVKAEKDSTGAIVEVVIRNVPAGLGDPVFKKIDAKLAEAMLSIGGVKGIEFGKGFLLSGMQGSQANDEISSAGFLSNNNGGILGGVSNGQDILFRVTVKPVPSIGKPLQTIDKNGKEREVEIKGRHDVCLVPRIMPVINSMVKLVLADCLAYQKLMNDKEGSLDTLRESIDKVDEDILLALYRRNQLVKRVAEVKSVTGIRKLDASRETVIKKQLSEYAEKLGINPVTVEKIWDVILQQSKIDNYQ